MNKLKHVVVSRAELEFGSAYMDINNPKFELNHLFVDSENIVSTNTRALAMVGHKNGECSKDLKFLISREVVLDALKKKKATSFRLLDATVVCINEFGDEFMTISCPPTIGYFPDYKRIVTDVEGKGKPFTQLDQITGIAASSRIEIDRKHAPKIKGVFTGRVFLRDGSIPVQIKMTPVHNLQDATIVIMPIVDTFKIFREEEVV